MILQVIEGSFSCTNNEKMKKLLILFICLLSLLSISQIPISSEALDLQAQQLTAQNWLSNLYEVGVTMTKDSLAVSEEFQKVLTNENYRTPLYPKTYTWEQALKLLQTNDLKKAFWFFINLYPKNEINKELVVKSILAYDQLLKMDEVLVATFYTYSFMDPEVSVIKDGKPEITRPDLLEAKLRSVKEITGYIYSYRKQKKDVGQ